MGWIFELPRFFWVLVFITVFGGIVVGWSLQHAVVIFTETRASHYEKVLFEKEVQDKTPKIDVKLFTYPSSVPSSVKLPLKEYHFIIQNLNPSSAGVSDLMIEFDFPNLVSSVKAIPLLDSGGDVSVQGMRVYQEGSRPFSYSEQPIESRLASNFSFEVVRADLNGSSVNTNIVVLTCERWPEGMGLSGEIVVDLSQQPILVKKPQSISKYEGKYFYKIKDKQMSGKIKGDIPTIG